MLEVGDFPGCCGVIVNHNLSARDVGTKGEEGHTALAITTAGQRLDNAMQKKGYIALATFKNPGTGAQLTLWILLGKKGGDVLCLSGEKVTVAAQIEHPSLAKLAKLVDKLSGAPELLEDIESTLQEVRDTY